MKTDWLSASFTTLDLRPATAGLLAIGIVFLALLLGIAAATWLVRRILLHPVTSWIQNNRYRWDDPLAGKIVTIIFGAYLKNNPNIHDGMTFLVHQPAPTDRVLPLDAIYVFSKHQAWVSYEAIQVDIFDHLLAAVPEFGLRILLNPTGYDLRCQVHSPSSPTT